jgi:hypothetical protein
MKKNVLFVVLFIGFIFSIIGQSVSDFEYKIENGGITITKYKGSIKDVVIPERINGLPVVAIGAIAFTTIGDGEFHGIQLTSITLPNSLRSIGGGAFTDNKLTSITLPNSITSIGSSAFAGNQLTSITLPNSITSIEMYAFSSNQLTSITLPNSITSIGICAFASNQLTSITLPNSITTIDNYAFAYNQLTSVTIPSSVTTIGECAFYDNKLTSIVIPFSVVNLADNAFDENVKITSLGQNESDFYYEIDNGKIIITGYRGSVKDVVIPEKINNMFVTKIDSFAFERKGLTSVRIPNSVTEIKTDAFANNQLTSVIIPNSVTIIKDGAFRDNKLTSLTIGNSVNEIEGGYKGAFENNQITSVIIPNSVKKIGRDAFKNNRLTSLTIGNSVTHIETDAFKNNQLTSITIPKSVIVVYGGAFADNRLTSVTIQNPHLLTDTKSFENNPIISVVLPQGYTMSDSNLKKSFGENARLANGQTSPSNPTLPPSPATNEIKEYAKQIKFAVLKLHTKTYTRDSYNAAWFDRYKASGNPTITINRKSQNLSIILGVLVNEYRFETTFYNSNKNVVVSVDVTLQFIDSPAVYVIYIPYAQQNHYDRRRQVDEPSGKYALHEQSVPCTADDGAKAFIQFYEEARNRNINNFQ